jgi:hypothetical protein
MEPIGFDTLDPLLLLDWLSEWLVLIAGVFPFEKGQGFFI